MRRGAVLLVIAGAVLVGACRSTTSSATTVGDAGTSAPTTTTTTSTAAVDDPRFPVTVESDLGPVPIAAQPKRIVSLSATHTEMLYAIGAGEQIAATDLTSNYPPEAQRTAKVDSFSFSVEEVAALEPDLVILAFDFQGEAEALAAVGIPFLLLGPPAMLEGAFQQLETVGVATGHPGAATRLADNLRDGLAELTDAAAALEGATFYHEVDEALYSASSDSFIGDLYRRLGLVNIADGVDGGGAFPQLTAEFIVAEDPEFIFLADAGFGVTIDSIEARPGWNTLRAVTDGNVIELDGDVAGRWGPRTIDLMAFVYRTVAGAQ
jgi:iron complex transport system substrate-binding protein